MSVWVGFHDQLGIVIYDPERQHGSDANSVRLWLVEREASSFFDKVSVRPHLKALEQHLSESALTSLSAQHNVVQQVAQRYLSLRPPEPKATVWAQQCAEDSQGWIGFSPPESDEMRLLRAELNEELDAWELSNDSGWFYDDET